MNDDIQTQAVEARCANSAILGSLYPAWEKRREAEEAKYATQAQKERIVSTKYTALEFALRVWSNPDCTPSKENLLEYAKAFEEFLTISPE